MPKRHFLIISIIYLAICLFYYLRMTAMTDPGFPLDDSWIHQVFARNIATGHGFSFNPDQPIAAATAPLWTIVLVPAWMVLGPIAGGLFMGILFQWLALLGTYKLARILTKNTMIALVSSVLTILFWPVIWGAMSGMETGLFSALSIWGLYFYFRSKTLSGIESYAAYLLFTLSFLSRPECILFIIAAVFRDIIEWINSENKKITPWIIKGGIILALTAPYFLFNYNTAGGLFPRTFAAKVMGKDLFSAVAKGDFKNIIHALTVYPFFYFQHFYRKVMAINPFVVIPLGIGLLKFILTRDEVRPKRIMLAALFILYVPIMGSLSPIHSATWQNFRYITNLIPIMIIIGISGLFWRVKIDFSKYKKPLFISGASLAVVGFIIAFLVKYFVRVIIPYLVADASGYSEENYIFLTDVISRVGLGIFLISIILLYAYSHIRFQLRKYLSSDRIKTIVLTAAFVVAFIVTIIKADFYANNVRNINDCEVGAGKLLGSLAKPGDVAAVNDIGAMGYYSNMEIFDLWGLISTELSVEMINNDSLTFEYMSDYKKVDYMVLAPDWFHYLPRRTDIFHPIAELTTENNTILAQDKNIVYKAFWPDSTNSNHQEQ